MLEKRQGTGWMALMPILAGFFVMGFSDIIGTVMNQVKPECGLSDAEAGFLPSMIFIWFFLVSIPAGILCGRIGRKNTVLASLGVTVFAMFLALAGGPGRVWAYFVSFALLGIGNTVIQAALPALMSNVVPQDQLTSRISLGQFVKAVCAALTPVFVYLTAKAMGNWKLLFPLYGAITLVAAVWLWFTPVRREEPSAGGVTFGSCLAQLGSPYILAMTLGVFFSVGADVGFGYTIPDYLRNMKVDADVAGMGPTVYFIAKTAGAFIGAILFAKAAPAKCFPWTVLLAVAGTAAMFFARTPTVLLGCVFAASLGLANTFGMAMGLAINRVPEKTNEISSLMVMAIVGGAVVTPVLGWMQGRSGVNGLTWVLLVCEAYLLGLGVFAAAQKKGASK